MDSTYVKELMVPLEEYPVVSRDATLLDAVNALEEAQTKLPAGRQPYRAVLVADGSGKIIGKIGQLAFLKALEPRYNVVGDLGKLTRVGLSTEFVNSMMEHLRLFQGDLSDLCRRGRTLRVVDVMRPVTESIDENASLGEAIHRIVMWQTLSVLVTRQGEVVGLLRLSDLCDEVCRQMKLDTSGETS